MGMVPSTIFVVVDPTTLLALHPLCSQNQRCGIVTQQPWHQLNSMLLILSFGDRFLNIRLSRGVPAAMSERCTCRPSTLDTLLKLFEERKITKHNAFEVDLQKTCEHVRYLAQTKAGFSASSSHVEAMQYVWGKKVENTKIALEQLTDKLLVRNGSNGTRGNSGMDQSSRSP